MTWDMFMQCIDDDDARMNRTPLADRIRDGIGIPDDGSELNVEIIEDKK